MPMRSHFFPFTGFQIDLDLRKGQQLITPQAPQPQDMCHSPKPNHVKEKRRNTEIIGQK